MSETIECDRIIYYVCVLGGGDPLHMHTYDGDLYTYQSVTVFLDGLFTVGERLDHQHTTLKCTQSEGIESKYYTLV